MLLVKLWDRIDHVKSRAFRYGLCDSLRSEDENDEAYTHERTTITRPHNSGVGEGIAERDKGEGKGSWEWHETIREGRERTVAAGERASVTPAPVR